MKAGALWTSLSPAARGIAAMVAATLAFSAMHAAIVHISSQMHPFQIAFFRNLFGFLIFVPVIYRSGLGMFHTNQLGLHGLRAALNVIAMFAFFTGLAMTPLARVTALAFTAPLFMALLSVIVFRERMIPVRWLALFAGFCGTLLILRPGFAEVDLGSVLVLVSALIWAVTMMVIKVLARTDSSLTITGYMSLLLSVLSFGPACYFWVWPDGATLAFLVFIGVSGTFAQLFLAEALKQTDATITMPFDFLKMVWAVLFGFVLFNQVPDAFVLAGAVLVFAGGFAILYAENKPKASV